MIIKRSKNLKVLSDEERRICQAYVDNDCNDKRTAKQVGMKTAAFNQLVKKEKCRTYISYRAIEKQRKGTLDYNYKMYKLKRVIDDFIPDDRSHFLDPKCVSVAIQAMAESNKMQGHYSAEKILTTNLNMDADLEETKVAAKEAMKELMEKHKSDY